MAESKDTTATSGSKAKTASTSEATFSHEQLIGSGPAAFGVAGFVVAGALNGAKQELTLDEAHKAVNKFLGR